MKTSFIDLVYTVTFLLWLSGTAIAQKEVVITYPDHKLGPFSSLNRFTEVPIAGSGYTYSYHFLPKDDKVKAYDQKGRFVYREKDKEVELARLYKGQFDGKKGKWIETWGGRYIFMDDLVDIEEGVQANRKAAYEKWEEERRDDIFKGLLFLAVAIGLAYLIYGLLSICPNCGAWWKRKHERTESLGSSTYQGTRSARKDVFNSTGSVVGHTFVDESYTKTTHHYRNHYCCEKCGHKWTKDKSS